MKVDQFKKLIKESIKEVLVEEGFLKEIVTASISEANEKLMSSSFNYDITGQLQKLKEIQSTKQVDFEESEKIAREAQKEHSSRGNKQIEKMNQIRQKMMESIGKSSYKDLYNLEGVDLFEGTMPLSRGGSPGEAAAGQGPLSGVEPDDAGVAIDSLLGNKKLWQQLLNKK